MGRTVSELAALVEGTVEGDAELVIDHLASVADADAGAVTFLTHDRYASAAASCRASALVLGRDVDVAGPPALIRVDNPDRAFARMASALVPPPPRPAPGVHPTAVVADDAELGEDVALGPHVVVAAGARIGARTVLEAGCYIGHGSVVGEDGYLYPHVSLREHSVLGDRVRIHNGAVIGSDGYGYVPEEKDGAITITKIPQVGRVVIGHDVEIGANVTVDRARFGETRIGDHVKIDNLVQIAHNVTIGPYTGIVAQTGIAGSAHIGSGVILWGQVGIVGHLHIGDRAQVGAKSTVWKDVPPGVFVVGNPARERREHLRALAAAADLPALRKRIRTLEKRLADMAGSGDG